MELAVEEARKCRSVPFLGEPKVGAVIVTRDGEIFSGHRGEFDGHPNDHAEFVVIKKKASGANLDGCLVFTTLEPCTDRSAHAGKTPCILHVLNARPEAVYIGMTDPNPTIRGLGRMILEQNSIAVHSFDRDLCTKLWQMNAGFCYIHISSTSFFSKNRATKDAFRYKELNRPHLARHGKGFHRKVDGTPDFPLISKPEWLPKSMVPLERIRTSLQSQGHEVGRFQPKPKLELREDDRRTATEWFTSLRPQGKLTNDPTYALTELKIGEEEIGLLVETSDYFSYYDNLEAAALELSLAISKQSTKQKKTPVHTELPIRSSFGDITSDFRKRPLAIGMNCLTILKRANGNHEFLFHDRSRYGTEQVTLAEANEVWHVVPAGSFQAAGESDQVACNFSRGIMREYAEELVSERMVESCISEGRDFFDIEKVARLRKSVEDRKSSLWWLGMGLDPVTTKLETLMLCIVDCEDMNIQRPEDYFSPSWEGRVFPVALDRRRIESLLTAEKCLPAGAACLVRALDLWDELRPHLSETVRVT